MKRFLAPSDSVFTRDYTQEVAMTLSSLDCALHGGHVIYASTEITSGLRLYETLRERNLKSGDDLKDLLGKAWYQANILQPNIQAANRFAEFVRAGLRDNTIVITPAPFFASKWSQSEFLYLWEELLRTRVKSVRFNANWQFSNGCAFEFAVARDAGLPTFDHLGAPLPHKTGLELIQQAIAWLESQNFDASKLHESEQRLLDLPASVSPVTA